MFKRIKKLYKDEDGAITVDWVVLTAAVVALASAAIIAIEDGTGSVGTAVGDGISGITVDSGL